MGCCYSLTVDPRYPKDACPHELDWKLWKLPTAKSKRKDAENKDRVTTDFKTIVGVWPSSGHQTGRLKHYYNARKRAGPRIQNLSTKEIFDQRAKAQVKKPAPGFHWPVASYVCQTWEENGPWLSDQDMDHRRCKAMMHVVLSHQREWFW